MPIIGLMNNFTTTLNGAINNSVTTITVHSVTGISTALASSDYVPLSIDDGTNVETVHVTNVSSFDLTVSRGQEGTAAAAFVDATTIECRASVTGIKGNDMWLPVKISTVTGSPAASVAFTGLTAGDYRVDLVSVGVDVTDDIAFVQGTGGSPTYQTSDYYYSGLLMKYNAGDAGNRGSNVAAVTIMPSVFAAASNLADGYVEMNDMATAASKKTFVYQLAMGYQGTYTAGGGVRDTAEAVTAIKFFLVGGNNFVVGSKFILSKRNH